MTQYTVTNIKTHASIRVEATSREHARRLAEMANADAFTDGKDGVWMYTDEVRDAAERFRKALGVIGSVSDSAREELLDLFQEALDETREAALDDAARDAAYPYN